MIAPSRGDDPPVVERNAGGLVISGSGETDEGEPYTATLTIPSAPGPSSWVIYWGDTAPFRVSSPTWGSGVVQTSPTTWEATHTYTEAGSYTLKVACVPGDADFDGDVDSDDAAILAQHWGQTGMTWAEGDFNWDGRVSAPDASILAANWGTDQYGASHAITVNDVAAGWSYIAPGDPGALSPGGVQYGSGDVLVVADDFGFGTVTRSYSALFSGVQDLGAGYGWQLQDMPYLAEGTGEARVTFGPQEAYWYMISGETCTAQFGATQTMTHDAVNDVFKFTDLDGTVYEFDDFSYANARSGQFRRMTTPGGATAEVVSWTVDGQIAEIEYTLAGAAQPYELHTYTWTGGHITQVLVQSNTQSGTPSWADVRRATYSYYVADENYGSPGDLKTVLCEVYNGGWTGDDTYYYRYYKDAAGGVGFTHGLKMAFSPEEYATAVAQLGSDPDSWIDSSAVDYSTAYYEYNSDHRATEATAGSEYTYAYDYFDSGAAEGYNNWARVTKETRSDGSTSTVYSNYLSQTLLTDIYDAGSATHTISYSIYGTVEDLVDGNDGRLILFANPSAVSGYSVDGNGRWNQSAPTFTTDGLVYETTYTAAAYVDYQLLREADGDPTPDYQSGISLPLADSDAAVLQHYTYTSRTIGTETIYYVASVTEYEDADGDPNGGEGWNTTTYSYTWHDGTFRVKEQTVTLPTISVDQNGSGASETAKQWFDSNGNLVWTMDERDRVTYYGYDSITGLLEQVVEDVDSGQGLTPPAGWSLPTDGLHLVTDYAYDASGRLTEVLGPAHVADINGTATTIRTASWAVYRDDLYETRTAQGYVVGSTPTVVGPIWITKYDRYGRTTEEIVAAYSSTLANLGTVAITQSDYRAWTTYQYDGEQLVSTRVYDDIPVSGFGDGVTNYEQTDYGYEDSGIAGAVGLLNRVQTPDGTITRTVYDARGSVVETWIGTNDTGSNNMVQVVGYVYDADGNLMTSTEYPNAVDSLTTTYQYDSRNRLTEVFAPGDVVTQYEYDNLGQTLWTRTYASDDTTLDPGELRAQTQNLYDDLGQAYESRVYHVDPEYGDVEYYLPTSYWYDDAGNLVKTAEGKIGDGWYTVTGYWLTNKYEYDSLGRVVTAYTCYDLDELSYADACDPLLTGDTVVEQTQTWYNEAGLVVAAATYRRLPDDTTSTGPLDASTGSNASYATATVYWYDGLGRTTASAYYGREDAGSGETHYFFDGTTGALFDTDSDGIPDRAESNRPQTYAENAGSAAGFGFQLLLTEYNDAGFAYRTIDDLGRIDETQYDDAGRVAKTIENRIDGTPSETDTAQDITVAYEYDSGGRLVTMSAYNAKGLGNGVEPQATAYLYESEINASWQTAVVYPDSNDTVVPNGTGGWTITSGTDHVSTDYDRMGRTIETTDQRSVAHEYLYDTAGRLEADVVTSLGASGIVDDSILAVVTGYDDVGRVQTVTNYDSNNPAQWDSEHTVDQVLYQYDGWGNVEREYQEHNGPVDTDWQYGSVYIDYRYDDGSDDLYDSETDCYVAMYLRLSYVKYPKLSQYVIARSAYYYYDSTADDVMSRPTRVETTGNVAKAEYKYLGANQVVTEDLTNIDIMLDYSANDFAAIDRFGRVVDQLWEDYGNGGEYGTIWDDYEPANAYPDHFSYTYNRAGNIENRYNEQHAAFDEVYTYDLLDRLTDVDRANGFDQNWGLDGLGNFGTIDDDGAAQTRTVNEANEIDTITGGWVSPEYDAAGNMIFGPDPDAPTTGFHYVYDAWNRLVGVYEDDGDTVFEPSTDDTHLAEYQYDGLNRRIKKTQLPDDTGWGHHYYYNLDWQILEDREVNTIEVIQQIDQYVWSPRYIDSPIACLHDGNADGDVDDSYPSDWRRYYLTDAQHNVTTTIRVDDNNSIAYEGVSRNIYTPYGEVTRCLEDWTPGGSAEELFDGPMYAGYWYDTDTSLYQVRNRFYDANLSTFLNRDPVGYAGGDENLYRYCGNDPLNVTDPNGLFFGKIWGGIKSAAIRYDQFCGQMTTLVWTGTWVAPETVSGLGMGWEGTKGAGRGAKNIGIGLKNTGKEISLEAYDFGTGLVEIGGRVGGADWRFESWSNLGQASTRSDFSYSTHVAETGLTVVTVGTYGEVKAGYQLYTGQITVDEASQVFGTTGVLQLAGARMMRGTAVRSNTQSAIRYGAHVEGPLPASVANTFRGGSYLQTTLQVETTLYRTYGGSSGRLGSYWSRTSPLGPLQASMDLALPRGNTAQNVVRITVPKGTVIYEGSAAPNFGRLGGGNQVLIPRVNPSWVKP